MEMSQEDAALFWEGCPDPDPNPRSEKEEPAPHTEKVPPAEKVSPRMVVLKDLDWKVCLICRASASQRARSCQDTLYAAPADTIQDTKPAEQLRTALHCGGHNRGHRYPEAPVSPGYTWHSDRVSLANKRH